MKTILLIDDEPELLALLEYLFSQLNYGVISYTDVVSVEMIKELAPTLIILDYHLGHVSGGDLCKQLKVSPDTQNIPVLLLSSDDRLPDLAKDSCADAYIEKPFDIAALWDAVKKITTLETL